MGVAIDGGNPTNTVTRIDDNHSCFPAHVVKTQRFTVYSWQTPRTDANYVFGRLVLQQGKIVGNT